MNNSAKYWNFILLFIFTVTLLSGCNNDEDILATFDGDSVNLNEYIDLYLLSTESKPDELPDSTNIKKLVLRLALEKMYLLEAKSTNIEMDSGYITTVNKIFNHIYYREYLKKEIASQIVSDSLIQSYYKHLSPQYKMYQIKRPFSPEASDNIIQSQNDTIIYVYNLLKSGKNFEDLAKKYSQDNSTKSKGGYLGFLISDSFKDSTLKESMKNLTPFTFSMPLLTNDGFYILYKGESRVVPIRPFEQEKEIITRTLYKKYEDEIENLVVSQFLNLRKKYNYKVNEQAVEEISKKAEKKVSEKYFIYDYRKLSRADLNSDVATYDGGSIKVNEILALRHGNPENKDEFREMIDIIARPHLFGKHAMELGYAELPEIQPDIKNISEKYMRLLLYKYNVKDIIAQKNDSLRSIKTLSRSHSQVVLERAKIANRIKSNFENKIKNKYNFHYIENNFSSAIKEAEKRKKMQINERAKKQ